MSLLVDFNANRSDAVADRKLGFGTHQRFPLYSRTRVGFTLYISLRRNVKGRNPAMQHNHAQVVKGSIRDCVADVLTRKGKPEFHWTPLRHGNYSHRERDFAEESVG